MKKTNGRARYLYVVTNGRQVKGVYHSKQRADNKEFELKCLDGLANVKVTRVLDDKKW
jgi:hypothetical protein